MTTEQDETMGVTLTADEEHDLRALLVWAFMAKPGIPYTRVLGDLSDRLVRGRTDGKRTT